MRTSAQVTKEKERAKINKIQDHILYLRSMEDRKPKIINELICYWRVRLKMVKSVKI